VTANTMFAKRERYDMQNSTTFRSLLNLSRIAILLCVTLSGCSPTPGPSPDQIERDKEIVEKAFPKKVVPPTEDEHDNLPKNVEVVPPTEDEHDNLPKKFVILTKDEYNKLLTRKAHTNEIPKKVVYQITGVVAERTVEISKNTSNIRLILKPSWQDSRVEVECSFDPSKEPIISKKQVGETVNVGGVFYSVSESTLSLSGCKLEE